MRPALLVPVLLLSMISSAAARISPDFIRGVVRAHLHEIQACYAEGLARRPDLAGRISMRWTIAESGSVVDASVQSSTLEDPMVEQCMVARVRTWTFAATARGTITIHYPFELRPSD